MNFDRVAVLNRLFSKCVINKTCFEFTGRISRPKNGYPRIRVSGKELAGHRVVYALHFGEIPAGLCVMHICDNTRCLNPSHLRTGTNKENTKDMMMKGRAVIPKPVKILTEDVICQIREMRRMGMYQKDVAKALGISKSTVRRAC